MTESLPAGVHRLFMERHAKPERLAAATIKTMDPER